MPATPGRALLLTSLEAWKSLLHGWAAMAPWSTCKQSDMDFIVRGPVSLQQVYFKTFLIVYVCVLGIGEFLPQKIMALA